MSILDFFSKKPERPSISQLRRFTIVCEYECDWTEPENDDERALVALQLSDTSKKIIDIITKDFGAPTTVNIEDEKVIVL